MTSGGNSSTSGSKASTSGYLQQQLPVQFPKVRISEPPQEPPSFADLIKEEDDPDTARYNMDTSNTYYSHTAWILNSDSMNTDSFYNSTHPTNHFLAKTHLGQTYLDLDSRCIAL